MGVLRSTNTGLLDFLRKKGLDLDDIMSLVTRGFYQKEGVDPINGFASVIGIFGVHRKDTHVHNMLEFMCGLLFAL